MLHGDIIEAAPTHNMLRYVNNGPSQVERLTLYWSAWFWCMSWIIRNLPK